MADEKQSPKPPKHCGQDMITLKGIPEGKQQYWLCLTCQKLTKKK